jgi:hypothetical protein
MVLSKLYILSYKIVVQFFFTELRVFLDEMRIENILSRLTLVNSNSPLSVHKYIK